MLENEIGKIEEARVFVEDHGLLCLYIGIDYGGAHQGFGPFMLAPMTDDEHTREGWKDHHLARNMRKLVELHKFLKVDDLSRAKGIYLEVEREGGIIKRLHRLTVDGGKSFAMDEDWE